MATLHPRWRTAIALLAVWLLGSCGAPAGAPCEVRGSGFQRSDNCSGWCMAHWPVRCADGRMQIRAQCSGARRCTAADCAATEVCYQGTNSFAVCVPRQWCPSWRPEDLR